MAFISFFFFSLFLSIAATPMAIWIGGKTGIIDLPSQRKVHANPVPRTGGIAIALGMLIPLLFIATEDRVALGYLLGAGCIAIFGFWDDWKDLNYKYKFLGQILAAGLFVLVSDQHVATSWEIWPNFSLDISLVAIPATIIFIIFITNAVNLSDGLNALAGGLAVIILSSLGFLAFVQSNFIALVLILVLLGSLVGFLRYNMSPALIFMGDCGSQLIGFSVAALLIILTQQPTHSNPVLAFYFAGTPIVDTINVILLRVSANLNPFKPDKRHLHHQLLGFGFSHDQAVFLIYLLHFAIISLGWSLLGTPDPKALSIYVILLVAVISVLYYSERSQRFRDRTKRIFDFFLEDIPSWKENSRMRFILSSLSWKGLVLATGLYVVSSGVYGTHLRVVAIMSVVVIPAILFLVYKGRFKYADFLLQLSFYLLIIYYVYINESRCDFLIEPLSMRLADFHYLVLAGLYTGCIMLTPERSIITPIDVILLLIAVLMHLLSPSLLIPPDVSNILLKTIVVCLVSKLLLSRYKRNRSFICICLLASFLVMLFNLAR